MSGQTEHERWVEDVWRSYLTTGDVPVLNPYSRLWMKAFKCTMRALPTNPRCSLCHVPFEGAGAPLARSLFGRTRSRMNPLFCNVCEKFVEQHHGGAEVELSMLFADVRGSTALAESMSPSEYTRLINRFYRVTSDLMIESKALLEQLIGDEVAALYVPGLAGPAHARVAIDTARSILQATGHVASEGPWIPVGIGVHTGVAFVGAVGSEGGVTTITALGDAVNTTARLASQAGPGEILVSEAAAQQAALETSGLESRQLSLKGRTEPVGVYVVRVAVPNPAA